MKSVLSVLLFALVLSPVAAYAETGTTDTTTPTVTTTETVSPTLTQSPSRKDELKTLRTQRLNDVKTLRDDMKATITAKKEEMHTMAEAFRDELKMKREEMQASMSAERSQFKTELKKLKDARKQVIVQTIDTKLNDINKNRTDKMAAALDKMSDFLTRLQDRVASLTGQKDTSAATTAINNAKTAIDTAKTAVANQAGKTYTPTVTDDATVGNSTSTTLNQMKTDMKSTYASVEAARKALVLAIREVAKLGGLKSDNQISGTVTPSVTISPSVSPEVTQPVSTNSAQ